MEKAFYKSVYVIAGKREDGTFGLIRTLGKIVMAYSNKEEAEKDRSKNTLHETIIVDVGAIVDQNLEIPRNDGKDISKIL